MSDFEVRPVAGETDELVTGGGLPRWVGVLGALVLVGALVVAIGRQHHTSKPAAAPTTAAARPTSGQTLPPTDVAYAVVSSPIGTWTLTDRTLSQVAGARVLRSVRLPGATFPDRSLPMITVDAGAHRIWLVLGNAAPSRMIEYDADTLRRLRDVRWVQLVQSAIAYRGHLYLSTDFGVADLAPGAGRPHFVRGLTGAVGALAVDESRGRLIAIDLGYPTEVWTYRPGRPAQQSTVQLPLVRGTLAVVDGAIWVGGFGLRAAVLTRLDPRTLRPIGRSPAHMYGTGAVVVGTGERAIWLRSGSDADTLLCMDAGTGRIAQQWTVPFVNAVSSDGSGARAATAGGMRSLLLAGCPG